MILPTKHLPPDRALIQIGGEILHRLDKPQTVSSIWEALRPGSGPIMTFDWFVLGLDFLFLIDAIEIHDGLLERASDAA